MRNAMKITNLQAIKYDPRTDVIEPLNWPSAEDMGGEITAITRIGYRYEPVTGWEPFTHRIRVHALPEEFESHRDYLATLEGTP